MVKIGSGSPLDPALLAALQGLEQDGSVPPLPPQSGEPDVADPTPAVAKPVDRRGAQAKLASVGVAPLEPPSDEALQLEKALQEKLQKLGYLPQPPAKVSQTQLAEGAKKFITDHKGDLSPSGDVDDLFALLDRLIAEDNARNNRSPAQWSGQRPASRPASLPAGSTYAAQGPAPNSAALQQSAAQSVATAHPPPPAGSINARVAEACKNYMGTSTAAGPDHGNLACAWSVNNILSNAGLQKVGSNPNYVPSVEQALQGGRGTAVDAKDAQPGDIVIFPGTHHIGIYMGNGKVANNSSSHAAFVNLSSIQSGMHFYRLNS